MLVRPIFAQAHIIVRNYKIFPNPTPLLRKKETNSADESYQNKACRMEWNFPAGLIWVYVLAGQARYLVARLRTKAMMMR